MGISVWSACFLNETGRLMPSSAISQNQAEAPQEVFGHSSRSARKTTGMVLPVHGGVQIEIWFPASGSWLRSTSRVFIPIPLGDPSACQASPVTIYLPLSMAIGCQRSKLLSIDLQQPVDFPRTSGQKWNAAAKTSPCRHLAIPLKIKGGNDTPEQNKGHQKS